MTQTAITIPAGVLFQQVADEGVLLDLDAGVYYGLNATGAVAWSMLQDGAQPAAIVERLTAEFDVAAETAATDLDALLADLAGAGLIRLPEAGT